MHQTLSGQGYAQRADGTWQRQPAPRIGDWMQTASGRQFWPLDPRPEEINIGDIAAALSKLCRYNGHCDWPYSVAQHSVYVSWQVPEEHALTALLHDATEAYCADVPRPLKPFLTGYAAIEAKIWRAVAERFGLPRELPQCVHDADNAVLLAEKAQIMRPAPAAWAVIGEPAPIRIVYWGAEQARDAFLARFEVLTRQRAVAVPPGECTAPNCDCENFCVQRMPVTFTRTDGVPPTFPLMADNTFRCAEHYYGGNCPNCTGNAGVTPSDFYCVRQGMCDATPRCTNQCASCADGVRGDGNG